jgi:mannose-1-phosphate guanylyltransferase/mannose-6-phosphate isomerase
MIVLPSDHLLEEEAAWADTIRAGIALAAQGLLVTIGLRPSSPETAYGYIRPGEPVAGIAGSGELVGREVIGFVEKPDAATAAAFLAEGGYLWNSGMLVTRADTVLGELRAAGKAAATPASAPGERIADIVTAMADIPREEWFADSVRDAYGSLAAVPFDKAVLEVSGKVAVLPTGLDWSDVGSLLAIEKLGTPDERGNVLVGRVFDIDSRNILAYSVDHLLATLGLEDVIVVDTSDATLVAAKDRAQDVRMLVEALKAAGAPEATRSRESLRPWGSWTLLMEGDGFRVKSIDVLPGSRLSLQSHHRRSEHWIVLDGVARAERDGEVVELRANESIHVPMGSVHRLENAGDTPLKVIEVAVGEYLGEDDIVRYADDWAREDR